MNDENITHVEGSVDPIRDIEIIETELLLADIDSLEKRIAKSSERKAKGKDNPMLLLNLNVRNKSYCEPLRE